jgi:hypothetical protein
MWTFWNKLLSSYKSYKIHTEWVTIVRFCRIYNVRSNLLKKFLWNCKYHATLKSYIYHIPIFYQSCIPKDHDPVP